MFTGVLIIIAGSEVCKWGTVGHFIILHEGKYNNYLFFFCIYHPDLQHLQQIKRLSLYLVVWYYAVKQLDRYRCLQDVTSIIFIFTYFGKIIMLIFDWLMSERMMQQLSYLLWKHQDYQVYFFIALFHNVIETTASCLNMPPNVGLFWTLWCDMSYMAAM